LSDLFIALQPDANRPVAKLAIVRADGQVWDTAIPGFSATPTAASIPFGRLPPAPDTPGLERVIVAIVPNFPEPPGSCRVIPFGPDGSALDAFPILADAAPRAPRIALALSVVG
jgi:hypothetical protein